MNQYLDLTQVQMNEKKFKIHILINLLTLFTFFTFFPPSSNFLLKDFQFSINHIFIPPIKGISFR